LLSLSTALLPSSRLSLAEQVRWLLDGEIPGIVIGAEIERGQIAALVQEVDGAGHQVTALEAPRPGPSRAFDGAKQRQPRRCCPSLAALDQSERLAAQVSLLDALELADRHQLERVILSPADPGGHDPTAECQQVIDETQQKIDRSRSPDDPQTAAQVVRWIDQQRQQLAALTRPDLAAQHRQQKSRDALLRSLDPALERASELGISMALRESDRIGGLPDRSGFLELYQIFHGAPLHWIADPAAAQSLAILQGRETVDPLAEDPARVAGCYLRDLLDGSLVNLGDGQLDLHPQFSGFADDDLRVIELSMGTTSQQVSEVASLCRSLGIDGAPPPQPGDPFPIIGA
jgi:hypothetical protein